MPTLENLIKMLLLIAGGIVGAITTVYLVIMLLHLIKVAWINF
jgi:hypothetical protein